MSDIYSPNFSLDKLREDPDFAALFAKKADGVRKNKADLVEAAQTYQSKYKKEIEEGTRKRQLMLVEGAARGLKGDDVFKDNQVFIPTVQTPILNYLYFLLREEKDIDASIKVLRAMEDLDTELSVLKEAFDKKYGQEVHSEYKDPDTPNMVSFIYKNIGDNTMATLKKLKTMAMSDNEKEAFVAFRKCKTLCDKFRLDFDKIPYNR